MLSFPPYTAVVREHVVAAAVNAVTIAVAILGVTLRSYAYVTSTVALLVSLYTLEMTRRSNVIARDAMRIAKGEQPPEGG